MSFQTIYTVKLLIENDSFSKYETIAEVKESYEAYVKIFFHYDPSIYDLDIHFINTGYTESWSLVEYSHDLDTLIFNLKMDSDYYKKSN